MYKVAIVIPTLNEERFIKRCLDSVRQQSYPFNQMDVMVVDGGSTDQTREIVKDYAVEYPNIRLLQNANRIQAAAFNIGWQNTKAEIIIRMDAHATYNVRYVELCYKHLQADDRIGNVGGIWDIRPQHKGIVAEANALLNQSRFGIGGAAFRVGAKAGYVETVPFGAFPRKVIEEIGGMNEQLPRGEDNEFNFRIRKAGYEIFLDPEIVATYYARDTIKGSMRQMYQNGYSIGKLIRLNPQIVSLRHLVPLSFVATLLLLLFFSLMFSHYLWGMLLCIILLIYTMAALIAAMSICQKDGYRFLWILPIMFFLIHISYGCGTIIGLLKKKY